MRVRVRGLDVFDASGIVPEGCSISQIADMFRTVRPSCACFEYLFSCLLANEDDSASMLLCRLRIMTSFEDRIVHMKQSKIRSAPKFGTVAAVITSV